MSQATPGRANPSQPAAPRRQTIEQRRAGYALGRVREAAARPYKGKYKQLVKGLPAMILTNGLGQTLAFLRSKGPGEHQAAYSDIGNWVLEQLKHAGDLLENVTRMDVGTYRLAQAEALAVLGWLKRLAEAELPDEGQR